MRCLCFFFLPLRRRLFPSYATAAAASSSFPCAPRHTMIGRAPLDQPPPSLPGRLCDDGWMDWQTRARGGRGSSLQAGGRAGGRRSTAVSWAPSSRVRGKKVHIVQ